ncbi:GNAT superfamily N-acetyltransferase [Rhizobium rosettiformans]|uniref:GNAT family N-acetyltransferase n=2 Tax=Rhizobium rosettiformans TaxID=1368430 RepID=A0A4S8PTH0_9HYPH|nr:GNAT family N-acetyltransferase [Rhizobium rosettiformans]MBB5277672.1 GNAT superfamily N-acetyltransferase [Rhizobium rosettiformans]THV33115.1 GNAT family N-acetyltransferase [Rhizobium rosettiformans W3]
MQVETVVIREATENDLVSIVALFADDPLGGHGDTTEPEALPDYRAAFARISVSQNETLYVAELGGEVVGTFQTMVTTTLTGRGSSAMIIEAVQTRADMRGRGIGAAMIEFAVECARQDGMRLVQLTSNAVRKDAHRFYKRLGFTASHIGFKLKLK